MKPYSFHPRLFLGLSLSAVFIGTAAYGIPAQAAQTQDTFEESKTLIALKLGTTSPVEMKTSFQKNPPTIHVKFPSKTVVGALPEVSRMDSGPVKEVITSYARSNKEGVRYIDAIDIRLNGEFGYRAWTDPGRVMVEIAHPANIYGTTDLGAIATPRVVKDLAKSQVPARFSAMQNALDDAFDASESSKVLEKPVHALKLFNPPSAPQPTQQDVMDAALASYSVAAALNAKTDNSNPYMKYIQAIWGVVGLLLVCLGYFAWRSRQEDDAEEKSVELNASAQRLSSGLRLIDALVWSAYERQGYTLIRQTPLESPLGILRTIDKDEETYGLLCVSHGLFCEQKTVEDFYAELMKQKLFKGILVTSGNYTIPAQRLAKKYDITLVGKQQLIELLTIGATNEYVLSQLDSANKRLVDAQKSVKEYSTELEGLRRQRNEASWYLGNERVRTAALEDRVTSLKAKLNEFEGQSARWQQAADQLRKSWEESQWYLGETQQRIKFLEKQLDQVRNKLKEQESPTEAPEATQATQKERTKAEPKKVRKSLVSTATPSKKSFSERRLSKRAFLPEVEVEMKHSSNRIVFTGTPLDVSGTGLRVETDQQLPLEEPIHVSIRLPGRKRRVVSLAKVMWQHAAIDAPRYQSGCQLIGLSSASKTFLEQLTEKAKN